MLVLLGKRKKNCVPQSFVTSERLIVLRVKPVNYCWFSDTSLPIKKKVIFWGGNEQQTTFFRSETMTFSQRFQRILIFLCRLDFGDMVNNFWFSDNSELGIFHSDFNCPTIVPPYKIFSLDKRGLSFFTIFMNIHR